MKRILTSLMIVALTIISTSSSCEKGHDPIKPKQNVTPTDSTGSADVTPTDTTKPLTGKDLLQGKKFIFCANSMVYYGGCVQCGNQKQEDPGMFYKILKANGIEATVIDNTWGSHHLYDYLTTGCGTDGCSSHTAGQDLLDGLDLGSFDYVILSEAGNNYSHFYSDAVSVFQRFTEKNPNAKLVYINHIYSVYKNHTNVLSNLQNLRNNLGVTIVNCGQLAYDIYTGAVKVPGGTLAYSDRYTFCNHTSSDTYHPNPLMGYIMTQMLYCALTGETCVGFDYATLVKSCNFAKGSTTYSQYYDSFYPNPAALPFYMVINNADEMKGIQQLIPQYVNKY